MCWNAIDLYSLAQLDAGIPEKIQLVSRDGENVLVVSYADLRRCVDGAFAELLGAIPSSNRS